MRLQHGGCGQRTDEWRQKIATPEERARDFQSALQAMRSRLLSRRTPLVV